jgi:hypothetical protein
MILRTPQLIAFVFSIITCVMLGIFSWMFPRHRRFTLPLMSWVLHMVIAYAALAICRTRPDFDAAFFNNWFTAITLHALLLIGVIGSVEMFDHIIETRKALRYGRNR